MVSQEKFSSPKIAEEIKKKFGDDVKTVSVKMKYTREIGRFIKKIDKAHQRTAQSTLHFQ